MTEFIFSKDKNLIRIKRIDTTPERNYAYDINSDTFFNTKTGRTISVIPGLITAIMYYQDNMAYHLLYFKMACNDIANFKEKIKLLDAIYNINPEAGYCPSLITSTEPEELRTVIKAYSKETHRPDFTTFFENYQREVQAQKWRKILSVDNLSDKDLEFLDILEKRLKDERKECNEKILRLAYFWWKDEGNWGTHHNGSDFAYIISVFLDEAKTIQYIPQKLHFYEQYTKVSTSFRLFEEEQDRIALAKWYNQFNLAFSNDLFEVVIPRSKQDFVDEAAQQHNCVFRNYYPEVIDQSALIVFVRYKNNKSKSYITCEIDPSTGEICQYLKQYNERVTDKNACLFENTYQNFLFEQFNSSSN